jgi:hypothetical protein
MYQPQPDSRNGLYAAITSLILALAGGAVYTVPKVVGGNDEVRVAQGNAVLKAAESIREVESRLNVKIDALNAKLDTAITDNAELRGTIKSLERELR